MVTQHLPTQSGWYWVLEDIGISEVRCVCWVAIFEVGNKYFPEGGVYLISPWAVHTAPLVHCPELHHKQWQPWDPNRHRAWEGPLTLPEMMMSVRTGEKLKFKDGWPAHDNI